MGLIQLFRIVWSRRWLLAVTTLTCLLGAIMIVRLIPPRYEAQSRVILDIIKPDPVTGQVIASGSARAYVKTQIELIQDYRIAGKVVDELGWTNQPDLAAAYQRRAPSDTRDFRRWLAQRIIDNTDARLIDTSNILEIKFYSSSPAAAAKVADTVRKAYVDQAIALKREDAISSAAWFSGQADILRNKLTQAEKRKADFERENGIILQDNNVDTETARLAALAAVTPTQQTTTVGGDTTTTGGSIAPQLAAADAAIENARRELGPNNPQLQAMLQQRAAMSASAPAQSRQSPTRVVPTGPSIGSLFSAQQAKVLAQRGKVGEAQRLATDVALLKDQYQKTSARLLDLTQQGEATDSGLTLLGNATAPQSPSFPNWPLVIFGSTALGLALGLLVALTAELLARRVRGMEDLNLLGVPVIGLMAKSAPRANGIFSRFGARLRPAV
ncbi:MAG: Wzz/FepE/Etk N-terminal domain-containing protein [Sphingomonas sp.]